MLALFSKAKIFLLSHRKKLIVLLVALIGIVFYVFLGRSEDKPLKPPLVGAPLDNLRVVDAGPVGKVESLDSLYPVYIDFNYDISKSVNYLLVEVEPYIKHRKFVLLANPKRLWIEPDNANPASGEIYGWQDKVSYKITVLKNSKTLEGHSMLEDYSFSFMIDQDVQAVVD